MADGKMDWLECKNKKLAKESKFDKNLFNSLIKSSIKRSKTEKLIELNDDSASSKVSLAYDVLRELLEALAISKGFKVYNHECYCSFLKEILNESALADKFDSIRKIRNSVNYYGKDLSSDEANAILEDISILIERIKSLLK